MLIFYCRDPEKAKALCKEYNIKDSYSYEQFGDLLSVCSYQLLYYFKILFNFNNHLINYNFIIITY